MQNFYNYLTLTRLNNIVTFNLASGSKRFNASGTSNSSQAEFLFICRCNCLNCCRF